MAQKQGYLTYDWKIDGKDALFAVDLELYASAPDKICDTLVFIFLTNKDGKPLSDFDRRKIDFFESKCVKKTGVHFAGYIEIAEARQYYAYTRGKDFTALRELAEKERYFKIRIAKKHEPSWKTYFNLLYPDAAKYQTVLNDDQIKTLYANGDSEAPRRLNLHMFFRNEILMMQFAQEALSDGYAIDESEIRYENKLPYGVTVRRICSLKKRNVDALTVHTIRLAERFGGQLLFWDCPIAPKDQM